MKSEPTLPFEDEEHRSDAAGAPSAVCRDGVAAAGVAAGEPQVSRPTPFAAIAEQREEREALEDAPARRAAVDPLQNVLLEASAGTGKTGVLVERYVKLLEAGVEPDHILAMTFTRKAAGEMRERIIDRLRNAARRSEIDAARWRSLKDRLSDIAISTIDAFCLSLLREFPLEADVDPGFDLADETEVPRLIGESLDQALRIGRALARKDDDVALVFAQLGERRLRSGVTALLNRRLVAPRMLLAFLDRTPRDLTAAGACRSAAARLRDLFQRAPCGLDAFLNDGPTGRPQFTMLAGDLRALVDHGATSHLDTREGQAAFRAFLDRLRGYFLTQEGKPRGDRFAGTGFTADDCDTSDSWRRHRAAAARLAPAVADAIRAFRRDLNAVMSRGVWRLFAIALGQYQRTLEARALLDFSGVLERAVALLRDLDEFAESRLRLEARYRHVLVDEFQDTSRAQWELIVQLVKSWSEGHGAATDTIPPSIFVVGDRKQSIYGFRDADVSIVDDAAAFIGGLRPNDRPDQARQAISVSFRSSPTLLSFINDLFEEIVRNEGVTRQDGFRYDDRDRFPTPPGESDEQRRMFTLAGSGARAQRGDHASEDGVGILAGGSIREEAERVATEILRLLSDSDVRDRVTGIPRSARPSDIAILCRSRDGHREFENALERRGVPTYVYKGLGFFDADEVQDAVAVLRFLADPTSDLRAATFLRSRLIRLSDDGLALLAPDLADFVTGARPSDASPRLSHEDQRVLGMVREAVPRWLALVDRLTPSELLDCVLAESAYAYELRGSRRRQARENLKKLRGMIRRAQNRGYATLSRIADHLDQLAVGDEANAAIDALDAVNLMTVHAAKGLEFPIVFIVNMSRGTGTGRAPIRVATDPSGQPSIAIADYQSETDEDMQARDREETKRLLYVAATRGRDRLYLSATVQNGVSRMGRGSLGEVLPSSIKALFPATATAQASSEHDGWLEWLSSHATHRLRVPRFGLNTSDPASTPFVRPSGAPDLPLPRGSPR